MSTYADLVSEIDRSRRQTERRPSGLSLSVDPVDFSDEPLALETVEQYLHAPQSDDALVAMLISGVREQVEQITRRLLTRRGVTARYEEFFRRARLPFPPIASVDNVTVDGETQDAESYDLGGRTLTLDRGAGGELVTVEYTAGYEDPPQALKMQMLRDIASRYNVRSSVQVGSVTADLPDESAYQQWKVT